MGSYFYNVSLKINVIHQYSCRQFCLGVVSNGKNYLGREAKFMSKFLNPTKKKRPLIFDNISLSSQNKGPKLNNYQGGKESSRRIATLNALFMRHVSDLLMTGNLSTNVVDKGIELTRISMGPSFKELNIYWSANSEENIVALEEILPNIGFELRHELSQLKVMGVVPRINFVKDKHIGNAMKVDYLLSIADFGEDHIPLPLGSEFKDPLLPENQVVKVKNASSDSEEEVNQEEAKYCDEELMPVMRNDIFNLDHDAIMKRVKKSMIKARALHRFSPNLALNCQGTASNNLTQEGVAFMTKEERQQALKKFIMSRKIQMQKRLNQKYNLDTQASTYDRQDDGDDYESEDDEDDYESEDDEDHIEDDDFIEDQRFDKN